MSRELDDVSDGGDGGGGSGELMVYVSLPLSFWCVCVWLYY